MQNVSSEDNYHDMSIFVFLENKKNISKYRLAEKTTQSAQR